VGDPERHSTQDVVDAALGDRSVDEESAASDLEEGVEPVREPTAKFVGRVVLGLLEGIT